MKIDSGEFTSRADYVRYVTTRSFEDAGSIPGHRIRTQSSNPSRPKATLLSGHPATFFCRTPAGAWIEITSLRISSCGDRIAGSGQCSSHE